MRGFFRFSPVFTANSPRVGIFYEKSKYGRAQVPRNLYREAVCLPRMAEEDNAGVGDLWAITAVTGKSYEGETEEEEKAAIERWTSLPAEERRRLVLEYGEKRMRLERFSYIP